MAGVRSAAAVIICAASWASAAAVHAERRSNLNLNVEIDKDLKTSEQTILLLWDETYTVRTFRSWLEQHHFNELNPAYDMIVGGVRLRDLDRSLTHYGVRDGDDVSVVVPLAERSGKVAAQLDASNIAVDGLARFDRHKQFKKCLHKDWSSDGSILGKGQLGRVYGGVGTQGGAQVQVAIKVQSSVDSVSWEIAAQDVAWGLGLAPKVRAYWRCHDRTSKHVSLDFVVMDMLSGGSLATHFHKEKQRNDDVLCNSNYVMVDRPAYVARDLYDKARPSLHKLASHGVLHGDLHQDNVMVEESGNLKFIDFGLLAFTGYEEGELALRTTIDEYIEFVVGKQWGCDPEADDELGGGIVPQFQNSGDPLEVRKSTLDEFVSQSVVKPTLVESAEIQPTYVESVYTHKPEIQPTFVQSVVYDPAQSVRTRPEPQFVQSVVELDD